MTIKKTAAIAGGALLSLALMGSVNAQEGEGPAIIEIFGCTFNDGNDLGDLMAVTGRWNDWVDENGIVDYTANILTPHLYSTAFPYDVVWLGVYDNPRDMGVGEANWLADGQAMNAEFGEVVTCSIHAQFAGLPVHMPEEVPDQEDGMVNLTAFQDCSLINQSNAQEAIAAHQQWGDWVAENGSDVFMGALFPIAGEDPAAEYDYKAVTGFSSAEAYGNFVATVIPGGLQRGGQIFGRVTQCDTPRLYQSIQVRAPAAD
ncbi:MAG TPA: hypothetical protein VKQ06_00870 [Gammaproteobacteria bacterium]|nr:hypothetical protein [Gammaproteobacteria bacterium]